MNAWDVAGVRGKYRQSPNVFSPILIWEGNVDAWDVAGVRGHGLWYGVSGDNAWMCNALNKTILEDGDMIYPLTHKEMLVMVHYGIGGVAEAMRGTGISEGEQA